MPFRTSGLFLSHYTLLARSIGIVTSKSHYIPSQLFFRETPRTFPNPYFLSRLDRQRLHSTTNRNHPPIIKKRANRLDDTISTQDRTKHSQRLEAELSPRKFPSNGLGIAVAYDPSASTTPPDPAFSEILAQSRNAQSLSNMEALSVIQKAFDDLRAIPTDLHLCCPKVSEEDEEDYSDPDSPGGVGVAEKRQRIQKSLDRQEVLYDCALILGLQQDAESTYLAEFRGRAEAVLGNCSGCIRNWHKGRKPFLKRLSQ